MTCTDYSCPPPATTGTTTTTTPAHSQAAQALASTGIDTFNIIVFGVLMLVFGLLALAGRTASNLRDHR